MRSITRILIVEDLPTDAELFEREARRVLPDSEFLRVETREDFVAALTSFGPDLILSDYRLPQFDGLRALKLALEHAPEIPFVIVTGSMNEDTAVDCMKAGAWDYIIKEHVKRLGPAILSGLEQKRLRRERSMAEQALRESEDKLKCVFEHSNAGMSITQPSGELQVNQGLCDMLGYSPAELPHRWQEITHPEDLELTQREMEALLAGKRTSSRFTKRFLHRNGSVVWADLSSTLRRDEAGRPLYFMTILIDITERKKAEDKVQDQLEELQRWQEVMLGREDRVQELKREVNDLCRRAGEPVRYPSQEADSADSESVGPKP